jgi:hypothetical protein
VGFRRLPASGVWSVWLSISNASIPDPGPTYAGRVEDELRDADAGHSLLPVLSAPSCSSALLSHAWQNTFPPQEAVRTGALFSPTGC